MYMYMYMQGISSVRQKRVQSLNNKDIGLLLLTLGAHAQRGLQYLVCVCVRE